MQSKHTSKYKGKATQANRHNRAKGSKARKKTKSKVNTKAKQSKKPKQKANADQKQRAQRQAITQKPIKNRSNLYDQINPLMPKKIKPANQIKQSNGTANAKPTAPNQQGARSLPNYVGLKNVYILS